MNGQTTGLRERKKAATRMALHEAALRLAGEYGPERVTVEAIADAAQVSRRTFSNYFSSKEEALFHGDLVRMRRLLELVRTRPASEGPWTALVGAAEQLVTECDYLDPLWLAQRRLIRGHPSLAAYQSAVYCGVERDLMTEIVRRMSGERDELYARVLAARFLATLRATIQHWINHPDRSLAELVRQALTYAPSA